jgi:hypothetical protein
LRIQDAQNVESVLRQRAKILFATMQFGLGLPALFSFPGLLNRASQGWYQPFGPLLQHVIGGTGPEAFHRRFLTNGSGDQHERCLAAPLAEEPKRLNAGIPGQREVSQNNIEGLFGQGRLELGAVGRRNHLGGDAFLLEQRPD